DQGAPYLGRGAGEVLVAGQAQPVRHQLQPAIDLVEIVAADVDAIGRARRLEVGSQDLPAAGVIDERGHLGDDAGAGDHGAAAGPQGDAGGPGGQREGGQAVDVHHRREGGAGGADGGDADRGEGGRVGIEHRIGDGAEDRHDDGVVVADAEEAADE